MLQNCVMILRRNLFPRIVQDMLGEMYEALTNQDSNEGSAPSILQAEIDAFEGLLSNRLIEAIIFENNCITSHGDIVLQCPHDVVPMPLYESRQALKVHPRPYSNSDYVPFTACDVGQANVALEGACSSFGDGFRSFDFLLVERLPAGTHCPDERLPMEKFVVPADCFTPGEPIACVDPAVIRCSCKLTRAYCAEGNSAVSYHVNRYVCASC
jgi:hypothetical protein